MPLRIAVVGCAHGEIEAMYDAISQTQAHLQSGNDIHLVVCCGDFQACRSLQDLETMACPDKFKDMHTFADYYFQRKSAPVLTVFVGGNHEASNHLQELPYGGWVAPNIYYLGNAGCVRLKVGDELVLSIAGLSGIFKQDDYHKGRYERLPYNPGSLRSVFHVKRMDVRRLEMLPQDKPIDVFISHDWPLNAADSSNMDSKEVKSLIRRKPFFREEIERNDLGSPVCKELLMRFRPKYWFSAHMHVKYATLIDHATPAPTVTAVSSDPDEIDLDEDNGKSEEDMAQDRDAKRQRTNLEATPETSTATKFLCLDKILPRRDFLQIVEIPMAMTTVASKVVNLCYDLDWLAVIKATHHLTPTQRQATVAQNNFADATLEDAQEFVRAKFPLGHLDPALVIPFNFVQSVDAREELQRKGMPRVPLGNPQTDTFFSLLGLRHIGDVVPCSSAPVTSAASGSN